MPSSCACCTKVSDFCSDSAANAQSSSDLVGVQTFIWVPIILALILVATLCMMAGMDADKNRDTILYAKFITNVKDK